MRLTTGLQSIVVCNIRLYIIDIYDLFPAAKINIGLYVYGVRPDGFHNLETVFFPVGPLNSNLQSDILEIVPAAETKIFQTGITYPGTPEDNLCIKAYNLMAQEFKLQAVNIRLRKQIPVGAGLGGGSADAACTLLGLNKIFALNLSNEKLAEFAAKLGSDCPFFIYNEVMLGIGRGEVLRPLFSTENNETKESGIQQLVSGKYGVKNNQTGVFYFYRTRLLFNKTKNRKKRATLNNGQATRDKNRFPTTISCRTD